MRCRRFFDAECPLRVPHTSLFLRPCLEVDMSRRPKKKECPCGRRARHPTRRGWIWSAILNTPPRYANLHVRVAGVYDPWSRQRGQSVIALGRLDTSTIAHELTHLHDDRMCWSSRTGERPQGIADRYGDEVERRLQQPASRSVVFRHDAGSNGLGGHMDTVLGDEPMSRRERRRAARRERRAQ